MNPDKKSLFWEIPRFQNTDTCEFITIKIAKVLTRIMLFLVFIEICMVLMVMDKNEIGGRFVYKE